MFSERSYWFYWCCVIICNFIHITNTQYFRSLEGKPCTTSAGKNGVCKLINNWQEIHALYAEGVEPKRCGRINGNVVFCYPQTSISKSEEQCEYFKKIRCPSVSSVHTIAGGEVVVNVQEFPHQVHLGYKNADRLEYLCGGSLISEQWILTAAHCLGKQGYPIVADMGFLNTENRNQFGTHQRIRIVEHVKHPGWKSKYNDIALLKLERPVKMDINVVPACLHNTTNIPTKQAVATGWGTSADNDEQSTDLMKVDIKILDHTECEQTFINYRKQLLYGIQEESQFCAGGDNRDTCQGDSGGPLQIIHPNFCTHSIIGVTSFGINCGVKPGIYTRVSHYIPWIESIVWPN